MRTGLAIAVAACAMALAGCEQEPEEAAGDLAEQEMLSQEDVLEEQADLAGATGDEAQEELLDEQADAMGDAADEAGEAAEEQMEAAPQ